MGQIIAPPYRRTRDANASPRQQYLNDKLYKHAGFCIEAAIEAFPQSILQLTAIVYYNEPNILSILSILISMSSVCSKILLLVMTGNAMRWKMRLYIWLCFVVDFFGIFFIVSYAFYTPSNSYLIPYFTVVRNMYFWQFLLCILPFLCVGSIGLHIYWTIYCIKEEPLIKAPFIILGISFLWLMGCFGTVLIMQIFCAVWGGMLVSSIIPTSRVSFKQNSKKFYSDYFEWIAEQSTDIYNVEGNELLVPMKLDKMRRLCIFNLIILEHHPQTTKKYDQNDQRRANWNNHFDEKLLAYLRKEKETNFDGVTLGKLIKNSDDSDYVYNFSNQRDLARYQTRRHPKLFESMFYEFYGAMYASLMESYEKLANNPNVSDWEKAHKMIGVVCIWLLTFVFGPCYILSRWMNVFFPLVFAIVLAVNDINLFVALDTFQMIMWIIYVLLLCVWFSLSIDILREDKFLWYVLPSTDNMKASEDIKECEEVKNLMEDMYFEMSIFPIIESVVVHRFGNDIACVILHYFKNMTLEIKDGESFEMSEGSTKKTDTFLSIPSQNCDDITH